MNKKNITAYPRGRRERKRNRNSTNHDGADWCSRDLRVSLLSCNVSCARFVRRCARGQVIQSRFQLSEVFVVNSLKPHSVVLYGWLISDCTVFSCTTSCRTSSRHRSQQPIQEHANEGSCGIDWIIVARKPVTSWATFTPDPI